MLSGEKSTESVLGIRKVIKQNLRASQDFEMVLGQKRNISNRIYQKKVRLFVLTLKLVDVFICMCKVSQFNQCH